VLFQQLTLFQIWYFISIVTTNSAFIAVGILKSFVLVCTRCCTWTELVCISAMLTTCHWTQCMHALFCSKWCKLITVLPCTVRRCPRPGGRRAYCRRQRPQLAHSVLAEVRSPRWSACSGLPGRSMAPRRRRGGAVDRGSCHNFTSTKRRYAYMCMCMTSRSSDCLGLYMPVYYQMYHRRKQD